MCFFCKRLTGAWNDFPRCSINWLRHMDMYLTSLKAWWFQGPNLLIHEFVFGIECFKSCKSSHPCTAPCGIGAKPHALRICHVYLLDILKNRDLIPYWHFECQTWNPAWYIIIGCFFLNKFVDRCDLLSSFTPQRGVSSGCRQRLWVLFGRPDREPCRAVCSNRAGQIWRCHPLTGAGCLGSLFRDFEIHLSSK